MVLTVSDTRTPTTDTAGRLLREQLVAAGHEILDHAIVKDEPAEIDRCLRGWLHGDPLPGLILTTGGTGIARRDTTIEIVDSLLHKPLPGFGELFRQLSFTQIGPAAMLSRATAGLATGTHGACFVFALPGSPHAAELALTKLILPELPHLLAERDR